MQQVASCDPDPSVTDLLHGGQLQLLGHHHVLLAHLFKGVLSHQLLQFRVLRLEVGGLQSLNVGALHAQGHEDLAPLVESAPSRFREGQALILYSEFLAYVVEVYFLDYLKTELGLALLTLAPDLC